MSILSVANRIAHYLAAAVPLGASAADPVRIDCPPTIDATEAIVGTADSWEVAPDLGKRARRLDSIAVFAGHPRDMASLVPDRTRADKHRRTSVWTLRPDKGEGYWVACRYTNSLLLLTRALPKDARKCELTERLLPSGATLAIEAFACE